MIMVWNLNDMKISNINEDAVDALISQLSEQYGKEAELEIHRGKVYNFLGMKLDYRESSKLKIDMTDYLKNILNDVPRKNQGEAITSEENCLDSVRMGSIRT